MTFTPIKHALSLDELDDWGKVTYLGTQMLGDELKAYGRMTHGAPTDPVGAAYFGTTKGRFRMTYPFSEQATVVLGEVLMTDESTGITHHLKSGDSWFVEKGTPMLWDIVSDAGFIKHYFAVV
ncbi:cupin domain-containing protein [Xanthomonas codiaei]|uniref:Cupin domain-containing protein n=1 Tax=Xanthomonas codiaei TaxID=56463 RepID=A0A2S7CEE0_9XANT|nr:cupin domain-containing protein [Xanthomonas codiaei]PPU59942.1 hypothetical protein XcodCFBP4690_18425 [Xanthomonas codiaei]